MTICFSFIPGRKNSLQEEEINRGEIKPKSIELKRNKSLNDHQQQGKFSMNEMLVLFNDKHQLNNNQQQQQQQQTIVTNVKKLKTKKRRNGLNWPFRKSHSNSKLDSIDGDLPQYCHNQNIHINLNNILTDNGNLIGCDGNLTLPLNNLLEQIFTKGPYTVGIFRKSANARICREMKIALSKNSSIDLNDYPVTCIASVFKEFLRTLPDGLLERRYYNYWLNAIDCDDNNIIRTRIGDLLGKLKPGNICLLKHFLCVLWHIAQKSDENKMSSINLAVCIGPSVLNDNIALSTKRCEEISKLVPKLIAYLIDNCIELFGTSITKLFNDPNDCNQSSTSSTAASAATTNSSGCDKRDSGVESDSINSLQESSEISSPSPPQVSSPSYMVLINGKSSKGLSNQRNRTSASIVRSENLSLSNLSRDSGLTLSDTQLYNQDDHISENDLHSSNGLIIGRLNSTKYGSQYHNNNYGDNTVTCKYNHAMINLPYTCGRMNGLQSTSMVNNGACHNNNNHNSNNNRENITCSYPDGGSGISLNSSNNGLYHNSINITYSYGRSHGISINGSCHENVLRKKRNYNLYNRHSSIDYIGENRHNSNLDLYRCESPFRYRYRRPPSAVLFDNHNKSRIDRSSYSFDYDDDDFEKIETLV